MTDSKSQMRAYTSYLLLLLIVASVLAKPADEDEYDYDEEDSWSADAKPPTRMLHVKMPNSKPQKDEV